MLHEMIKAEQRSLMEEEDALERVGSTGGGFFPDTSERSSHDPASSCCEITNRISVQVEKRLKIG